MSFKQIILWVSGLATTVMSIFSVYQNYQDVTSVNTLVSLTSQDTTFIVLTHPPKNFERVKSFVETHVIDLDHPDTLDVRFSRVKAQIKRPLFPLNTNNEKDTSFLVMQVDTSFKMVGDTEGILIGNHLDTAMIEKITLNISADGDLIMKNRTCKFCESISAYGDCFVQAKNKEKAQFIFYTIPMNPSTKSPYMTYVSPEGEAVSSRSRRYFAEDIPKELPIKIAGESLIDIHVFDVDCALLSTFKYEDDDEEVGFSASQVQLIQPGMIWSKTLPLMTLPPYVSPDVITAGE